MQPVKLSWSGPSNQIDYSDFKLSKIERRNLIPIKGQCQNLRDCDPFFIRFVRFRVKSDGFWSIFDWFQSIFDLKCQLKDWKKWNQSKSQSISSFSVDFVGFWVKLMDFDPFLKSGSDIINFVVTM